MVENFPILGKETDIPIQEAQGIPNKMNPKRPTPRCIIIKLSKFKDKERILKSARETKLVVDKRTTIRLSADFLKETLQARSEWHGVFKMLKEKSSQQIILYRAKLSLRIEEEVKSSPDKQKLKQFITIKTAVQKVLKGLF